MKENKSQDNKEPKGPYKHFERPTTSRRAMHHRRSEPETEVTSRKPSQSESSSKGPHHSQLWAGLIIVAIILIALLPIVSSRLHSRSNNLAEKSVKVSQSSSSKSHKSKSKKTKQSSSKKSKSKSSAKTEEKSSSSSQDTTPAVVSQSESQSSQVSQSRSQSYETSASQNTTQAQTQQSTQQNSYQNNQNTWQNNGGSNSSEQRQSPSSYMVQEGDSLSKIARENNTSVHHLEQINGLESADSISIGQSIKLR